MNDTPTSPDPVFQLYAEDAAGATVILQAQPRRFYRERFWTMFLSSTQFISQMDRPAAYHRSLFFLLTVLDPIQYRRVASRDVAEGARISQPSAERAMAMLEADHVIIRNPKSRGKMLRLNNRLCWASDADRHNRTDPDPVLEDARGR